MRLGRKQLETQYKHLDSLGELIMGFKSYTANEFYMFK